jgi:signal transduction histidine kinase
MSRAIPFSPLPVIAVLLVTVLFGFAAAWLGTAALKAGAEKHAAERARVLCVTLAAQLESTEEEDRRASALRSASSELSAVELLIVDAAGNIGGLPLESRKPEDLLAFQNADGFENSKLGRAAFATCDVRSVGKLVVLSRVAPPNQDFPAALLALVTLLLLASGSASIWVVGSTERDLVFVKNRVGMMARVANDPAGDPIPSRGIDEVGRLTAAFNQLRARFAAAQNQYQTDLLRARTHDRDRALFLAAVSHELRSPLNAILGFTDLLLAEVDGPLSEDAFENAEQIKASGVSLQKLIGNILEYSALEGGQVFLKRERVDLHDVLAELTRQFSVLAQAQGLSLTFRSTAEADPLFAMVDPIRFRQIMTNLVGNALKFTRIGEVIINLGANATHAIIQVEDTGIGIAQRELDSIFDEFRQVGSDRARKSGFGLGLAITRRLVHLHHGTIAVRSELAQGTVFNIELPLGKTGEARTGDELTNTSERPALVLGPGDHR